SIGVCVDRRQQRRRERDDTEGETADVDGANAATRARLAPKPHDAARVEEAARDEKAREHCIEIRMLSSGSARDLRRTLVREECGRHTGDQDTQGQSTQLTAHIARMTRTDKAAEPVASPATKYRRASV